MSFDIRRTAQSIVDAFIGGVYPLLTKPVRDLAKDEAWAVFYYLVAKGELLLHEPVKNDRQTQVKVGTTVGGVSFMHAQGENPGRFGSVGAYQSSYFQPTPAFAIVLYRLAVRLRSQWGTTKIVWGGIGAGSGKNTLDCHMTGNCVDFYGATTPRAGSMDVRRDWYYRPVYKKDGKLHPAAGGDAWGNDNQTSYRLLVNKDVEERLLNDKEYYNPRARDFFADVYTFISEECAFHPNDISPTAFRNGQPMKAGYTMHPDYPTLMRRPHNDHIHFQLGQAIHKR